MTEIEFCLYIYKIWGIFLRFVYNSSVISEYCLITIVICRRTWVAQLVKPPTPIFSSQHDLMVLCILSPIFGFSLSFSLPAPPQLMFSLSLSLKINLRKCDLLRFPLKFSAWSVFLILLLQSMYIQYWG